MTSPLEQIEQYLAHGWQLTPILLGRKGPDEHGWQQRGAAIKRLADLPIRFSEGMNVGLMHAYSGTMAFDIDDWDETVKYGIDLDALYAAPDAVTILSGRPGRGKLLYRMPPLCTMPTKKYRVLVPGGPTNGHMTSKMVFEMRCATTTGTTHQDVLPPSIHPDTQLPYKWGGAGHWSRLPMIPTSLIKVWQGLVGSEEVPVSTTVTDASWPEIGLAVNAISPDCSRDEWIAVGMGLHHHGTMTDNLAHAFDMWKAWSTISVAKYCGDREIAQQWASFKAGKDNVHTIATVYHIAGHYGWVRPAIDAAALFAGVTPQMPHDIKHSLRPAPPDLDLDLFPDVLAKRAKEVSKSIGCDPLSPLWAGLGAVCAVVDAQSRLQIIDGFRVPPVLWLMTVGDPADKKSPGSRPMLEPLKAIEATDRPRFKQDQMKWEFLNKQWDVAKLAYLKYAGSPESLMGGLADAPKVPDAPAIPVPLKFTVGDITSSALVQFAAPRPRGLLCYLDEMNGWVNKVSNPYSGDDRSAWVSAYESVRYEVNRVKDGVVHAENFAVSMYGNIQPRVLRERFEALTTDGLLQRFLPAVLRHDKDVLGEPIPEFLTSADAWETLLRLVYSLPPTQYKLAPDAYGEFREFQKWYHRQKANERLIRSSDTFLTAFGKLEGLAGRLILIFHVIENPHTLLVDAGIVARVVRLVKSYVIPVYRHLLDEQGSMSAFGDWMSDYIIQHADMDKISLSKLKVAGRRQFELAGITHAWQEYQWVLSAMYDLEQHDWVRRLDDGSKEAHGKADWAINPALKTLFRDHRLKVIRAKKEIKDYMNEYTGAGTGRVYGADELDKEDGEA